MEKNRPWESLHELSSDPYLSSKYDLIGVIGEGCFGKVFKAKAKRSGRLCALKLEHFRKGRARPILKNQIEVLKKLQGRQGIPILYSCGEWGSGLFCEMELLEYDMNTPRKYSANEITELTLELLRIMEGIHKAGIVHQDLKPHNIMRKDGKLYIIDFGLARQLSTEKNKNHYSIKGFIGTPRYASVRAHNMFEQGQKDDLQSLFYNIAYLFYQRLPWSKLHVASEAKLQKIKQLKIRHHDTLFQEMPPPFEQAFQYITALAPFEDPDYVHLTGLFKRTRTVVLHSPSREIHQKANTKRASLNIGNFLRVPDAICELKLQNTDEQRQGLRSNRSFGAASDAILSEYLQFEQDFKENYCESENIEPTLPDISKFLQNFTLRNPFSP